MSTSVLGDAVLADMILADPPTPTAVNIRGYSSTTLTSAAASTSGLATVGASTANVQ